MARYHETATGRSSQSMRHPSSITHRLQNHHPTPSMQGPRGHNINFHPPVAASSYRISSNSSRNIMNSSQNLLEVGRRQSAIVPPTGFRISRPNRGVVPETALRHQNLPHLRLFQADVIFLFIYAIYDIFVLFPLSAFVFFSRNYMVNIPFIILCWLNLMDVIFLGGCNTRDSRPLWSRKFHWPPQGHALGYRGYVLWGKWGSFITENLIL